MEMDNLKKKGKVIAAAGAAALLLNLAGCAHYAPASGNTSLANCGKAMSGCKGMNSCKGKNGCGHTSK